MIRTEQVSQSRYSHVQRNEVPEQYNSLVSRINSIVQNCWTKRASQAFLLTAAAFIVAACFTNPFGIAIGVIATAVLVSTLVLSILIIERLGSSKKSNLHSIEGRPSLIQNDFIKECRQVDAQIISSKGSIENLYIDSLHGKVKSELLGEDLQEQLHDFISRHPERAKDIELLKNILILNSGKLIDSFSYIKSLGFNLEQLSVDIDRRRKIKFEGELLGATDVEPYGFDDLECEFSNPGTVKMILQSIDKWYPDLSLVDKNALVASLHQGALFECERDLNEQSITIREYANTSVTKNKDGSFSIEMDLLLKGVGDSSKAPLIPGDQEYKKEIAKRFGMVYVSADASHYSNDGIGRVDDHFFRSIVGCAKAHIDLVPGLNRKYVRIGQIEKSPAYLGDAESISLSSRPSSFSDEVSSPSPLNKKEARFNWFPSRYKGAPSFENEAVNVRIGGSFSDSDENIYSRGNSLERDSFDYFN